MGLKTIVCLGLLATLLLITSEVAARDLVETSKESTGTVKQREGVKEAWNANYNEIPNVGFAKGRFPGNLGEEKRGQEYINGGGSGGYPYGPGGGYGGYPYGGGGYGGGGYGGYPYGGGGYGGYSGGGYP